MSAVASRLPRLAAGLTFLATLVFAGALHAQGGTPQQIAKGDSLFNGKQMGACWSCHGANGKGSSAAPKLADEQWLNIDGSLEAIKGVIQSGVPKPKKAKTPMPAMGGAKLTPEQIDDLAAYVYSLSHKGK